MCRNDCDIGRCTVCFGVEVCVESVFFFAVCAELSHCGVFYDCLCGQELDVGEAE